VFDIGLGMECCEGVEVIHREVLRWIVIAPAGCPLEATCPPKTGEHELLAMVIITPGRELLMQVRWKPGREIENGIWCGD
jgi:hypothetical protein